MSVKAILSCRSCQTKLPTKPVFSLGNMAVVDFPAKADDPQVVAPLNLVQCPKCELVQLTHSVDPDTLYREFWYRSSVTATMRDALKDVVDSVYRYVRLGPGDSVMDIGTNDGTLLEFYSPEVFRVGFEPARNIAAEAAKKGLTILPEFFDRKFIPENWEHRFKVISAVAMFYDLENPGEFLETIKLALHPDGIFIVQMNYLGTMLSNLAVDNICHEHLTYYSIRAFQNLLDYHGMGMVGTELNDLNGGSVRFYVKAGRPTLKVLKEAIQNEPENDWELFRSKLREIKDKTLSYLCDASFQGRRLGVLGASTRGLTTLRFLGMTYKTLKLAAERDPSKWGRFYGATGIPICTEEFARKEADVLLCLPWHFSREIEERERDFIEHGGELLFPLPKPRVVSKKGATWL